MNEHQLPKIGLRTLKTGLAVFLCLVLFPNEPFFACMTSIFCIQNTMTNSLKMAFVRGFGTLYGGTIGLIFLYFIRFLYNQIPNEFAFKTGMYLLIAVGVIIVIYTCNWIGINSCINIACIVFLAITTANAFKAPLHYATNRIIETLFGILIALLVNKFVTPPKHF